MLTIRRVISNLWLAATPLVIILALVAALAAIGIASTIIAHVAGPEAADNFVAEIGTLFGMVVLFTPVAIAVFALISLARWFLAGNQG